MLTPMLVQYLVGLCCLRRNSSAVDITLGDMVTDPAAGTRRDVDITVTVEESPGVTRAFKAYEVKKEKKPLDVAKVEQLCVKLSDMPSVTHRAIVSASGFTKQAQSKASKHDVELYEIKPWTLPLEQEFPGLGLRGAPSECLRFNRALLYWIDTKYFAFAPSGPARFNIGPSDSILSSTGGSHSKFSTFIQYYEALLLRSTGVLFPLDPASTILRTFLMQPLAGAENVWATPLWPHTHTLDVSQDDVYVAVGQTVTKIEAVTISGFLQWRRKAEIPLYYVLSRVPGGEPFAGAMVALGNSEGEMLGLVLVPHSREVGVHNIQLEERHWNAIRELKLLSPATPG